MVTGIDDQFGELLRVPEGSGIADDTIVLFASDHGDLLGSHHMFNKDATYEEVIRIPMIFRCPSKNIALPKFVVAHIANTQYTK